MTNIDVSKVGFFYQTSRNPCAVEMNLRQIKKYYPRSPVTVWEDVSNDYEDICKRHNVFYRKVYRLPQDTEYHQSQPMAEICGGLNYLNRIYVSLMTEMKGVKWFVHMEDDVWIKGPVKTLFDTGWGGGYRGNACGGAIISRSSFIEAYLTLQEVNWLDVCADDSPTCRYSDKLITFIMDLNNMPWTSLESEWSQGGYEDYKVYETPLIHNIKYWYKHRLEDLDTINNKEEVKFFLEKHG